MLKKSSFKKKTYKELIQQKELKRKAKFAQPTQVKSSLKRGSMVKYIPLKMREELAEDLFMKTCCLLSLECKGRIEFHHNLIYAGKRVNEYGAILPVCHYHHEKESKFKKQLDRIMEFRMTREEKNKYPKKKWL